jgi:hypothetical protein
LYTTKYPDENLTSNYIFDTKLENRLKDQDQSICDGKVTEEECSNAINNNCFEVAIILLFIKDRMIYFILCLLEE